VYKRQVEEWGAGSWKSPENAGNQPHEANFLKLDCTKANNKLGWYPVIDIQKTIQMTTRWYKEYHQGNANMLDVTLADIDNYTHEALRQKAVWAKWSDW
jgi:CDP-glucose 4,6-dehydratase